MMSYHLNSLPTIREDKGYAKLATAWTILEIPYSFLPLDWLVRLSPRRVHPVSTLGYLFILHKQDAGWLFVGSRMKYPL